MFKSLNYLKSFFKLKLFSNIETIKVSFKKSILYIKKDSRLYLNNCKINSSCIMISEGNNEMNLTGIHHNSSYEITGKNNKLILNNNRNSNLNIIIRGNNNNVIVHQDTTFYRARIVCMGENNTVEIGKDCMFGENIEIWASDSHPIYNLSNDLLNPSGSIYIGDHTWVALNAVILKNVTLGKSCIVGMNSIVTKSFDNNSLIVGNPAKIIKVNVKWDRLYRDNIYK